MKDENENLQKRLYVQAKRKGLRLQLSRNMLRDHPDYQTYRILDRASNEVLLAARQGGYGLTLEQVEEYLNRHTTSAEAQSRFSKRASESKTAGEQRASVTTHAEEHASSPLVPSGGAVVILDAVIPRQIVAIYNLIVIWCTEDANGRAATAIRTAAERPEEPRHLDPTCEEYQVLEPYFDAYRTLTKYSQHQVRLYMFARLLGLNKE
jgi:hypothetical protein